MARWIVLVVLALVSFSARAEMSVQQAAQIVESGDQRMMTYLQGLAQGAYQGYVNELIRGGLSYDVANAVAAKRCGDLTVRDFLEVFSNSKVAGQPVRLVLPAAVFSICHEDERKS